MYLSPVANVTLALSDAAGDQETDSVQLVGTLRNEIEILRTQIHVLTEQLCILKKKIFGSSSEKISENDTPNLFNEFNPTAEDARPVAESVLVPEHTRRTGGRKPLSDKLPREERIVDLSDEEKLCKDCGSRMEKIGEDITERAEIIPPKILVEKCIRPKCVCRACKTPPVAKELPYVLPHSIAANGMFAYIATSKFCDAIPFHRLEGILARYGVEYSKANMCNNVIQFHEKYGERIAGFLEKQVTRGSILHIDETTLQVMDEPGRKNTAKSYVWNFLGGGEKPAVVYSYRETRHAGFLAEILAAYRGTIVTDGYSGYDSIVAGLPIDHAGCNAHARRYFVDALEAGKDPRAETAIQFYKELYRIEAIARKEKYSAEALLAVRQEKSKPVMNQFREWLYERRSKSGGYGGALVKAVNYTLNQWPKLTLFLGNAEIPIDNNNAENKIRPFVIGRKNWMISGSPRGAEAACMFYSLIESAKINGHEPYWYLRRLFDELPYAQSDADIERIMPYNLPPITGSG